MARRRRRRELGQRSSTPGCAQLPAASGYFQPYHCRTDCGGTLHIVRENCAKPPAVSDDKWLNAYAATAAGADAFRVRLLAAGAVVMVAMHRHKPCAYTGDYRLGESPPSGRVAVLEALKAAGANLAARAEDGATPFSCAAAAGRAAALAALPADFGASAGRRTCPR